jgi:hypothetical protein
MKAIFKKIKDVLNAMIVVKYVEIKESVVNV